jgi:hypothetical protein
MKNRNDTRLVGFQELNHDQAAALKAATMWS